MFSTRRRRRNSPAQLRSVEPTQCTGKSFTRNISSKKHGNILTANISGQVWWNTWRVNMGGFSQEWPPSASVADAAGWEETAAALPFRGPNDCPTRDCLSSFSRSWQRRKWNWRGTGEEFNFSQIWSTIFTVWNWVRGKVRISIMTSLRPLRLSSTTLKLQKTSGSLCSKPSQRLFLGNRPLKQATTGKRCSFVLRNVYYVTNSPIWPKWYSVVLIIQMNLKYFIQKTLQ